LITRYSVTNVTMLSEQNYIYMLVLWHRVDAEDDVRRNVSYERKTAEFHMYEYFYNIKFQVNEAQTLLNVDEWFLLKI